MIQYIYMVLKIFTLAIPESPFFKDLWESSLYLDFLFSILLSTLYNERMFFYAIMEA